MKFYMYVLDSNLDCEQALFKRTCSQATLLQILQQNIPAMKQLESERTLLPTWAAQAHVMEKAKD